MNWDKLSSEECDCKGEQRNGMLADEGRGVKRRRGFLFVFFKMGEISALCAVCWWETLTPFLRLQCNLAHGLCLCSSPGIVICFCLNGK